MPALSDVLLISSFQFSLFIFSVSLAMLHQHYGILLVLIRNIGHRTLPKIWVGTFFYGTYSPGERLWIDTNGKNGN